MKDIKTISRLVVLPDYQGIGIGTKFLNVIADVYARRGFQVKISTTARNMIAALRRSERWVLTHYGRSHAGEESRMTPSLRTNCRVATFYYQNKE